LIGEERGLPEKKKNSFDVRADSPQRGKKKKRGGVSKGEKEGGAMTRLWTDFGNCSGGKKRDYVGCWEEEKKKKNIDDLVKGFVRGACYYLK